MAAKAKSSSVLNPWQRLRFFRIVVGHEVGSGVPVQNYSINFPLTPFVVFL